MQINNFKIKVFSEYISFFNQKGDEAYKLYSDGVAYNLINPNDDIPQVIFDIRDFFNK